jgi:hypothetical protein
MILRVVARHVLCCREHKAVVDRLPLLHRPNEDIHDPFPNIGFHKVVDGLVILDDEKCELRVYEKSEEETARHESSPEPAPVLVVDFHSMVTSCKLNKVRSEGFNFRGCKLEIIGNFGRGREKLTILMSRNFYNKVRPVIRSIC